MAEITYEIVEHDGGWAYKVGGSFSETFPTHEAAHRAAARAAAEQRLAGDTTAITYENAAGEWKTELAQGDDRPETSLDD